MSKFSIRVSFPEMAWTSLNPNLGCLVFIASRLCNHAVPIISQRKFASRANNSNYLKKLSLVAHGGPHNSIPSSVSCPLIIPFVKKSTSYEVL